MQWGFHLFQIKAWNVNVIDYISLGAENLCNQTYYAKRLSKEKNTYLKII